MVLIFFSFFAEKKFYQKIAPQMVFCCYESTSVKHQKRKLMNISNDFSLSLSLSLSLKHTHTHTFSLFLFLSLSHTQTQTLIVSKVPK
jgi:hypothetical protein